MYEFDPLADYCLLVAPNRILDSIHDGNVLKVEELVKRACQEAEGFDDWLPKVKDNYPADRLSENKLVFRVRNLDVCVVNEAILTVHKKAPFLALSFDGMFEFLAICHRDFDLKEIEEEFGIPDYVYLEFIEKSGYGNSDEDTLLTVFNFCVPRMKDELPGFLVGRRVEDVVEEFENKIKLAEASNG